MSAEHVENFGEHAAQTARPAGRTGAGLCAARQQWRQLYVGGADPGHRRPPDAV